WWAVSSSAARVGRIAAPIGAETRREPALREPGAQRRSGERIGPLAACSAKWSAILGESAGPPMDETELEELKREIVESRSLSIKTNNLINALAADLKSIAKRQQGYERRVFVNSATAYAVTIAVILLFVKLAWDIRLDTVRGESEESRERVAQ